MFKYIKYGANILLGISLVACSSGGNSGSNSGGNNATNYGGVDKPAVGAYYFSESGNTHSAMIRLTTESSGIMYFNSSVTPKLNIKSAITSFNKSSSTCLPSTVSDGQVGGVTSHVEMSLTNCVFDNHFFTATLSVKKESAALYESSVVFRNIEIASYDQVKSLSDLLPESNPNLYYVPMANTGKLNFNISVLGTTSSSISSFGTPFGELMSNFVNGVSIPTQLDIGSADVVYKVVDSTSLMMYISNIQVNNALISATMHPKIHNTTTTNNVITSASQQIECNVIASGMVVDNQLNANMHGFLTGCNGVVSTTIGDVHVLDGTIAVYGLN